jgi:hypothetical protein|tara:strand:- start:1150 stop:1386 length:237 start_codon:yes stop_codon:yes gene_type:complete
MAKIKVIEMLRLQHKANVAKALLTLELLTDYPAGIGDHSTTDFYNNADEAIKALAESEDVLETIQRHFPNSENKLLTD